MKTDFTRTAPTLMKETPSFLRSVYHDSTVLAKVMYLNTITFPGQ